MLAIKEHSTLLIDSNAYMYRFFYGTEPRHCPDNNPVHVVYAFMGYARRLLQQYKPKRLIFVFDADGKNFRHELFSEYKSHRDPMPTDLASQIEPIKKAIELLGIPLIEQPEVEADDSIASLAKVLASESNPVYIFSRDKDLMQLINDHVFMVDEKKQQVIDRDVVFDKFGIEPERIVQMLALMGDEADNIPGVDGIGAVTAAKLINQWGSVDKIVENSHWLKGAVGNNLRRGVDALRLSEKLTQLKIDLYSSDIKESFHLLPEDKYQVHLFCKKLGFHL